LDLRRNRTLEREGKPGNHQEHCVRYRSNTLIDFADKIAEASAKFVGWNDAAADFIGHKDDGTRSRAKCQAEFVYLFLEPHGIFAMRFEKIRRKECEAVDQENIAVVACGVNGTGEVKRFFDRRPGCGPFGAVPLDFGVHLSVVAAFRRCNERDATGTLGDPLRESALATADTAEHENYGGGLLLHTSLLASDAGRHRMLSGNNKEAAATAFR